MEYINYSIQSNGTLLYDLDNMAYGFRINETSLIDISIFYHSKLSTQNIISYNTLEFLNIFYLDIFYIKWFFLDFYYVNDYFIHDNIFINYYLTENVCGTIINIFFNI